MKKKGPAKHTKEFDRRFDAGEDIHDLIDMSKAPLYDMEKRFASHLMLLNHWLMKLMKYVSG